MICSSVGVLCCWIGSSRLRAIPRCDSGDPTRWRCNAAPALAIVGADPWIDWEVQSGHCSRKTRVVAAAAKRQQHQQGRQGVVQSIRRYLWSMLRALELLALFGPVSLVYPMFRAFGQTESWQALLVWSFQKAGPTFVKLGQWASTRSDLFSHSLRSRLSQLHGRVSPEPFSWTLRTLESADVLDSIIYDVDTKPIGAGCVAQVHQAKSRLSENEKVAVKIRRHGIRAVMESDLHLLNCAADIVTRIIPRTSQPFAIHRVIREFSDFMLTQLDLSNEGSNLERFNKNFARDSKINFPRSLYASRDGSVLVETYERGELLSELLREDPLASPPHERSSRSVLENRRFRKDLARTGVRAFLKMVVTDNFCHSDLHPGNILVNYSAQVDGKTGEIDPHSAELRSITFVDAGLTTALSPMDQQNFIDLFTAVAQGKGEYAGRLMIERADKESLMCTTEEQEQFVEGMDRLVSEVRNTSFRLDRVQIGQVLQDVMSLVYNYRVPVDPRFSTLVLSIILVEGIGRQLDPSMDIFKIALPILLKKATVESTS